MQRGFGGTVFEPVQESRDKELTLGPATLIALVCGLFVLCGLCFVFGYAVGHRNSESIAAASLPNPGTALAQPASPVSKPSAFQAGAQPTQAGAAAEPSSTAADEGAESSTSGVVPAVGSANPGASASTAGQPPVRTALTTQSAAGASIPAAGGTVQPAFGQPLGVIMVQIAAVSHVEDADVLVSALRKRGYAVSSRRDPADGLIHVQVGPFPTRNDAVAMRQKLLNDGYNAIVQP